VTFIVLEGGEGVGKSTQVQLLAQWLHATGREVVVTYEPGATKSGAQMRAVLLHADVPIDPRAELLLMAADRAQHVAEQIRPALERGAIVVCDRYMPSTLAYQGVGRGLGVETVETLSGWAAGGLEPDLVLVLDLPDAEAEARVSAARDRMERAGAEFNRTVRAAYRELAPDCGWKVVDASGTPEDVAARVREAVQPFVQKPGAPAG
jgi:dTMP kinase